MKEPPRWVASLLARLLDPPARDEVLGDLGEEHRRRSGPTAGARYAAAAVAIALRTCTARIADDVRADLRVANRQLRRAPGFVAVSVTALALGLGVNATILAVANDVLLSPLPYPDAERLVVVTNEHTGSSTGGFGVSWLNMQDVARSYATVEAQSLFIDWRDLTLSGPDGALRVPAAFVDDDYPRLMGLETVIGRLPRAEENRVNDAAAVVVLSNGAWRRIYGSDPDVIGRVIRLNGLGYEIIGVLSDDRGDLRYRWGEDPVAMFLPLFAVEALVDFDLDTDRGLRVLNALLRLRPGVGINAARADFDRLSADLARESPEANEGWSLYVEPLDEAFFEDLRGPMRILVAGSLLVLAMIAANLVSLQLIRTAGRQPELAVRRVLGASRGRLSRQLVVESSLLGVLGAGAGVLVALWGVAAIRSSGLLDLPAFAGVRLEGWIVAAIALTGWAAGLLLGLTASAAAGDRPANDSWTRTGDDRRRQRVRQALVAAEVALAFTVLMGSALVLTSFRELSATGHGFATDDLLLARVDARGEAYVPDVLRTLADELTTGGRALPGVVDAFIWAPNRLGHGNRVEILTAEGRFADNPEERLEAPQHAVHPGTLGKLGIGLLAGRDFDAGDHAAAPRVALVSDRLARDLWPDDNPIGRRFETVEDGQLLTVEVVGVAADALHRPRIIDPDGPRRDVYYPFAQTPWREMSLALRVEPGTNVAPLAAAVRNLVRAIDPDLPVYEVATMAENLREQEASARLSAALVVLYGGLCLALAALGLYGMMSHAVRARRREIGVRLALGADPQAVLTGTMRGGLVPVASGCVAGLAASLAVGRLLASALYGVSAYDAATVVVVAAIVVAVSVASFLMPARRACRTDPVQVLRAD